MPLQSVLATQRPPAYFAQRTLTDWQKSLPLVTIALHPHDTSLGNALRYGQPPTIKSKNTPMNQSPAEFEQNSQAQLALSYVRHTGESVFLTGKAGTGKTTLLRALLSNPPKRLVVTSPTGVAAINAGGVTLHSFFQLPRTPFIPEHELHGQLGPLRFTREKLAIIKSLELLIIDEISMVRADTLDRIDAILRQLRRSNQPFGGIQLLMIGDLHQLSPVINRDEQALLNATYPTPYFFQARAFHNYRFVTIALEHIYRQSDPQFIELLNQVRSNRMTPATLQSLNSRFNQETAKTTPHKQSAITLTTHNKTADKINQAALDALPGQSKSFTARIENDYPAQAFPAPDRLTLKVGAQVMFVRNDMSGNGRYFNGKIATVTALNSKSVTVRSQDDGQSITVEPQTWENFNYTLDPSTQEIKTEVTGTYVQFPLQLAWAVTIHKSQGLTFDKVVIDAQAAFAAGQVYVALSRCRSLEGIELATPIDARAIRTDAHIQHFSDLAEMNRPSTTHLQQAQNRYQRQLIHQAFDFGGLQKSLFRLCDLVAQHEKHVLVRQCEALPVLLTDCNSTLFEVAQKFARQLERLFQETQLPTTDEPIQARVIKAVAYFMPHLERLENWRRSFSFDTDNKDTRQTLNRAEERLRQRLSEHLICLEACRGGFDVALFLKARARATLGPPGSTEQNTRKQHSGSSTKKAPGYAYGASELKHPKLYDALKFWREMEAKERGVMSKKLIAQHLLIQVAALMPSTKKELSAIHGLGPRLIKDCGQGLIDTVLNYCRLHGLSPEKEKTPAASSPQPNTQTITLTLYQKGLSVADICDERGLTQGTIKQHLAEAVEQGLICVNELLEQAQIELLLAAISQHETEGSQAILAAISENPTGKGLDFNDIRLVRAHIKAQEKAPSQKQPESAPLVT